MGSEQSRRLRRDAEDNRQRIMAAARTVFAERGLSAPLEDVARKAEVNIATLYRRFPEREALIEAVLADRMTDLARLAEEAMHTPDPWEGFKGFVERICAMQAADRAVTEAFTACFPDSPAMEEPRSRAIEALDALIRRAQQQHRLRSEITSSDVILFLMANTGVLSSTRHAAPGAWQRLVSLLLDSCRPDGPTSPLPPVPGPEELHDAMLAARPRR
ncbi:TetR/AcrR family transcriptional regulator [Streptomyces sp. BR123]|uniref:TetR/AcrR family transcriptional regulator n=1 Tax=Streptomyces sp. BR123 TaxID=2749828 RepID=UPI0015C43FA6|nr:TetR/AcrR family transcriptional regulator [Streptomyces sp. BR123]NXY94155.1 TetR/AcrR family transcriptional regulator [Streptomyces sp. BR123]